MRDALNSTGRQIYFSLCGWNDWYAPEGALLGNSWRIAGDCNGWDTIYNAIRTNEPLWKFARKGRSAAPPSPACALPHPPRVCIVNSIFQVLGTTRTCSSVPAPNLLCTTRPTKQDLSFRCGASCRHLC
jgi:hypothetical protein